jgi:hypothetical protein
MLKGLSYSIPKWLAKALGVPDAEILQNFQWPGFDHVRTYKRRVVIAQPYEGDGQTCENLAKLHQQGICIRLWGISPYFPGRTFSVLLWRSEDEPLMREICEEMAKGSPDKPNPETNVLWH